MVQCDLVSKSFILPNKVLLRDVTNSGRKEKIYIDGEQNTF